MSINSDVVPFASTTSSFPQVFVVQQILWENLACDYLRLHHSTFPQHVHSMLQISLVASPSVVTASWQGTGKQQYQRLVEGESCIIPSQQPHTITWENDAEIVSFLLAPEYVTHAAHDMLPDENIEFVEQYGMKDALIRQLGMTLLNALQHGQPERLYVESLATILAVHIRQVYTVSSSKLTASMKSLAPHTLRDVIEYIDAHLNEDLSLIQLAGIAQISPFYLSRTFKQAMGETLHQYIVMRRIARAKILLTEKHWSILDICHMVGFQSQSHFTSLFRKYVSITPHQYRMNGYPRVYPVGDFNGSQANDKK